MQNLIVVLTLLMLFILPPSAAAQDTPQTVHLLEQGFFYAYKNELGLFPTLAFKDPVKLRMGAWWTDTYLAIISGNLLSGDERRPRQDERGFFGIRHNDSYPKAANAQEFVVNLTDPGCSGQDVCQRTRLRLTTEFLELYGRRVNFDGTVRSYLAAGRWELHVQESDGNFVLYERVQDAICPRWAISWLPHNGTGYVDRAVLAPPCH